MVTSGHEGLMKSELEPSQLFQAYDWKFDGRLDFTFLESWGASQVYRKAMIFWPPSLELQLTRLPLNATRNEKDKTIQAGYHSGGVYEESRWTWQTPCPTRVLAFQ